MENSVVAKQSMTAAMRGRRGSLQEFMRYWAGGESGAGSAPRSRWRKVARRLTPATEASRVSILPRGAARTVRSEFSQSDGRRGPRAERAARPLHDTKNDDQRLREKVHSLVRGSAASLSSSRTQS